MSVFPRAKFPKVFDGLGTSILEQLHLDAPCWRPAYRHVEEHHGVASRDRLVIFVPFCFWWEVHAFTRQSRDLVDA